MPLRTPITLLTVLFASLILIASTARANYDAPYNKLEGQSPSRILGVYWLTMDSMEDDPNLPIYTKKTQEWKQTLEITRVQMMERARSITACGKGETIYGSSHAVIRYHIKNRRCAPYYFKMEDDVWRLDFLKMWETIGFDSKGQWSFSSRSHEYMFAFTDWKFDKNGTQE